MLSKELWIGLITMNNQNSNVPTPPVCPPVRGDFPKLAYLFLAVSLLGFLDATYLAIEHYRGVVPPCAIVTGCETVTTSQFSLILGVPVALLGAMYYLLLTVLSILYFDTKNERWIKQAAILTPLGLLASTWFIYLQAFIIKAWCLYCLGSAVTSTLLFIVGMCIFKARLINWSQQLRK